VNQDQNRLRLPTKS